MDYNTVRGIEEYLARGLEGLLQLREDRHKAWYERKEETLDQFIVLGRFRLDTCGNFDLGWWEVSLPEAHEKLDWLPEALHPVIPLKLLGAVLPHICMTSSGYRPPNPDARCDICGEGWTLANAHDAVRQHDENREPLEAWRHNACSLLDARGKRMVWYRGVVEKAGLRVVVLSTVASRYSSDDLPWCVIRTPVGEIMFGWRRHVVELSWDGVRDALSKRIKEAPLEGQELCDAWTERGKKVAELHRSLDAKALFPNEDVTKGETHIHAWGEDKLIEYLLKLSEVLKIGNFVRKS